MYPGVTSKTDLRALRKQLGTQTQVAQLLGISRFTIGNYERDGGAPKWYLLALERLRDDGRLELPKIAE